MNADDMEKRAGKSALHTPPEGFLREIRLINPRFDMWWSGRWKCWVVAEYLTDEYPVIARVVELWRDADKGIPKPLDTRLLDVLRDKSVNEGEDPQDAVMRLWSQMEAADIKMEKEEDDFAIECALLAYDMMETRSCPGQSIRRSAADYDY